MIDEEENHSIEKPDPIEAVDRIAMKFEKPLEAAGVEIGELRQEFQDMLEHSVQFISLSTKKCGGGCFTHLVLNNGPTY